MLDAQIVGAATRYGIFRGLPLSTGSARQSTHGSTRNADGIVSACSLASRRSRACLYFHDGPIKRATEVAIEALWVGEVFEQ